MTGGQKSPPMEKLYAIIFHHIQSENRITTKQNEDKIENSKDLLIEENEADHSDQTVMNIYKEVVISRHMLTKGKKGKPRKILSLN